MCEAMTEIEIDSRPVSGKVSWRIAAGIVVVSLIYFVDICFRASQKLFWLDELFTDYLCRLPTFHSTWTAVLHGADFNPPLFYLLTRGAQHLFGDGLIATRLPAIVGVWVCGLCLYTFVGRRAGPLAGFIAGVFPFFTLAQYYAYEARPHGITLGWCGLALVCWQRAEEGSRKRWLWLTGFGLSLTGALLTHVYGMYLICPFGVVWIYDLVKRRRIDWGVLTATALAIAVSVPVYLPLIRSFRSMTPFATLQYGAPEVLQRFLLDAFGPALAIFVLAVLVSAWGWNRQAEPVPAMPRIPQRELLIATALACLPLFAILGTKVNHGPFFNRYLLSSIAGVGILLAYASSARQMRSWVAQALAASMFVLMLGDFGLLIRHYVVGAPSITEPTSKFVFTYPRQNPLTRDEALLAPHPPLDILVVEDINYLYLVRYASPELAAHLYFGTPMADDFFLTGFERLAKWAHVDLHLTTFGPFLATHDRFLVYGKIDGTLMSCEPCTDLFLKAGYTLVSVHRDTDNLLYEYRK